MSQTMPEVLAAQAGLLTQDQQRRILWLLRRMDSVGVYHGDPNSIIENLDPSVAHWPKYELPNPQNYIFTINETFHTAPDTHRAEAINYLMDIMIASQARNCTSPQACGAASDILTGETSGLPGYSN